jgi:transposase InsO family protein
MNVMLNAKKFKCLVDTGSACTIIRKRVATKLGLRLENGDVVLRSFSGENVATTGVVDVRVRVGQPSAVIKVVVVDDDQMTYDCIIGRDFLNLRNVMLLKIGTEVRVCQLGNVKQVCEIKCGGTHKDEELGLVFGEDVNYNDKVKCKALLTEFEDRISHSMATIGKTDAAKMEIKLITQEPVACSPYRMPLAEKEVLRGILEDLLINGIIRESTSSYASPILLVKKKTGDYRMCVDYRRLNAITVKDKYPLPLIEEQLDRLGGNSEGRKYKYFTALDMFSGFYQVPVHEDSVDKTAFITPDSHYEFLRMPFGLCNSPSVFQRLMNNVLGPLKNTVAFPYMDDIIIPSTTVEEGLQRLRSVLEVLRQHNLTLKLSKCSFFRTKIDYLGREISEEGIRPGQTKIDAILRMDVPRSVKHVRQFLGLSGYFRKFVQNYASVVEPLTRLLKRDFQWCWGGEQQAAFEQVKLMLTSRPVLAIFDPTLPTELHTDASSSAVAAILLQIHDGVQRVVAYFSKQTTVDQRQYHSYELETMAVVYALHHFRVYLLGLHFTVVTDCNALRTAFSKKDLIPRVGRWWLQVQEFVFDIKYRPGARMPHVDALSRYPITVGVDQVDITEGDWILSAQLQDEKLARIRKILESGVENRETKQYFHDYVLKNNKIYRKLADGRKVWAVPHLARWQIVRLCHDRAGHLSVEYTIRRIRLNYYFPKMRRFVTKYISACLNCAYYKHCSSKKQGKLYPIEKKAVPFHTIHIDHVGPFETSKKGNKYLLVIVDAFTKFTVLEAVKSTKVKPVTRTLHLMMCIFGVPTRIISDRGSAFTSRAFRLFCDEYAIKHVLNAVATPRANGQCERYNKTVVTMLATTNAEDDSDRWDTHVKTIQSALNTSFNKSINGTPVQALFGYQARPIAEAGLLNSLQEVADRIDLQELRGQIKDHISDDQRKQKERYDRSRREADRYEVGDLVLVSITSEVATGSSRKLLPKFKGPFRVTRVLFNDRYEVEDLRERRFNQRTVVAVDKMKRWITLQM